MNKFNTFVINWVGPFLNIEELKKWENRYNIDNSYNFYIITGKQTNERNMSQYCGITQQDKIYCRFYKKDHPIHQFIREINIWIGELINEPNKNAINYRKKIELCETMIISFWQPKHNIKKKEFYPNYPVALINRWFNLHKEARINTIYSAQELPDVIVYDEMTKGIYIANHLQKIVYLS